MIDLSLRDFKNLWYFMKQLLKYVIQRSGYFCTSI